MMKLIPLLLAILSGSSLLNAQVRPTTDNPLFRKYRAGETLVYLITGTNEKRHYEIQANGVVTKDGADAYIEEFQWSKLVSDDRPMTLSAASLGYRQRVTLDPNRIPAPPNLSTADPQLIGPINDFGTFYADLWLAAKLGQLKRAGDHFHFSSPMVGSWADGTRVILGQSSIDFDLTLKSVSPSNQTAVLVVRHVPPEKPAVTLHGDWMRIPVADTPNNWVQVTRRKDGKYEAGVGKETFDVEMEVSLENGKILSGKMDNLVQALVRECEDEALTRCGDSKPQRISREIQISLMH